MRESSEHATGIFREGGWPGRGRGPLKSAGKYLTVFWRFMYQRATQIARGSRHFRPPAGKLRPQASGNQISIRGSRMG